jgi:hypothetical protein
VCEKERKMMLSVNHRQGNGVGKLIKGKTVVVV